MERIILKARMVGAIQRALAWLGASRQEIAQGAGVGVAILGLLCLSGDLGLVQRHDADPLAQVARKARGQVSASSLALISAGMSGYARAVADRAIKGEEWTPPAPDGLRPSDFNRAPSLLQRNLSFEEARSFNALVQPIDGPIPALKAFILPAKAGPERARAELCLTQAVYYEAGNESGEGQEAVAQVILNRLRHPAYPKSVCGVVYQGSQRTTGCQFSFTCDGSLTRAPSPVSWARSQFVAKQALNGFVFKPVGTSTHYHADYVFPYWAVTLVKLKQIGAHIFYRMTGPAGTTAAFDGKYAGGETALTAAILQGGDNRTPDAPSVVAAPLAPPQQTLTLTLGGETRTYLVNAVPGSPAAIAQGAAGPPQPGAVPPGTVVYGSLNQTRRMPTVEEMQDINEKLRVLEEKMATDRAAGKSGLPGEK
jgi:hypothetical protein